MDNVQTIIVGILAIGVSGFLFAVAWAIGEFRERIEKLEKEVKEIRER